jgi:hypothetical protein
MLNILPAATALRSISLLLSKWILPSFSGSRFCHGFCTSPPENGSQPNQKQQIKTLHSKASAAIYKWHRCFRHYHSIALWHPLRYCHRSISLRSGNHPSLKCLDKTKSCLLHCLPTLFCSLFLYLPFLPFFLPSHNKNTRQNLRFYNFSQKRTSTNPTLQNCNSPLNRLSSPFSLFTLHFSLST